MAPNRSAQACRYLRVARDQTPGKAANRSSRTTTTLLLRRAWRESAMRSRCRPTAQQKGPPQVVPAAGQRCLNCAESPSVRRTSAK